MVGQIVVPILPLFGHFIVGQVAVDPYFWPTLLVEADQILVRLDWTIKC